MCGIVFAGGSLSSGDLEIFNQMLYCDVFRGAHATGIFAKRHGDKHVKFCKVAGEPYPFMHTEEYISLTQGDTKYVVPPTIIVGHNRHATRGNAGDAKNAHPFNHGNITLVHNGTLIDQDLLPDSNRFVVDSENICYSIDKIGAAETIQKLDGAFTLIWHDASDDTLHIIRNSERPFHLAQIGTADWFGASEEDMLMWLLKRSKGHKNRITKHFECEVGVEYVFDVSGPTKRCVLKEEIKHNLPTFTMASRYGYNYSRGWQRDSYNNRTYSSSVTTSGILENSGAKEGRETAKANEREKQNALAIEANIEPRIGSRVNMSPHSWFPYTTGAENRGRITGWVYQENGEYFEVDAHACPIGMWEDCCDDANAKITGTVVSIQKVNNVLRVIISKPSLLREGDDNKPELDIKALPDLGKTERKLGNPPDEYDRQDEWDVPFEPDLPASFVMDNGNTMTREQWGRHDHSKCGGCDKEIPWRVAVKGQAIMAYNAFWHEDCLKACLDDNGGQSPDTFLCCVCGGEKSMSLLDSTESARRHEDVCVDCGAKIRNKRAQESESESEGVVGVSVIYVDKSTTAIIDDNDGMMHKVFTRQEFERMIKMRDSDVARFEDLGKCYVEKRSKNIFAYNFKKGENSAPILPKEEKTPSMVSTFSAGAKAGAGSHSGNVKALAKTLTNGNKELQITKALWNQIGQCHNCHAHIPWRDVEKCALAVNNRVICPNCRGK